MLGHIIATLFHIRTSQCQPPSPIALMTRPLSPIKDVFVRLFPITCKRVHVHTRQFPSPIEISHRHFRGKISSAHALQLHRVFRFPQNSHSMSLHRPLPHRHRRTQVSLILQRARQTNTPSLSKFRQPLLHPLLRQLQARAHTHTRACARAYTHESMNVYVRAQRLVGVVFISLSLSSLSHLYFGISREQRIRARILSMLRSERLLAGFSSTRILHCNDVSLTYALVYLFLRVSYVNLHVHSLILSHSHTHTPTERKSASQSPKKKNTQVLLCVPPFSTQFHQHAHSVQLTHTHSFLHEFIHSPAHTTPKYHSYIYTQHKNARSTKRSVPLLLPPFSLFLEHEHTHTHIERESLLRHFFIYDCLVVTFLVPNYSLSLCVCVCVCRNAYIYIYK